MKLYIVHIEQIRSADILVREENIGKAKAVANARSSEYFSEADRSVDAKEIPDEGQEAL